VLVYKAQDLRPDLVGRAVSQNVRSRATAQETIQDRRPSMRATAERTAAAARREELICCLDSRPLDIDIVWQFPETCQQLLTRIAEVLGFPGAAEEHHSDQEWQFGGLRIRIRTSELARGVVEPVRAEVAWREGCRR